MNSKALESFLIPEEIAIEGLSEKTKGNLTIGAIGVAILAVIGLKISDYKKDKIYKSQVKSNNEMKKKNLEVVNNKYKLSTMSENEYKQFINRIKKESESYVKQMVNKANHDSEYIKSVRNKFIERNKNPDTGELESYDKETLKYIKSGYFTSNWNREGYWEIIEDQDVATSGCDLHCDIAEALNTKYSELSAANIVWFSFGDGDEGCVYFGHSSYENMKKKFNEVGIATESFLIPIDENTSIAEEGLGTELLKLAGKGALQILKKLAIFIGINVGVIGLLVYTSDKKQKEIKRRFDNPTPEEKLSRDNYINTWRPEIKKFNDMINKDIKEADKKLDIAKFIDITNMSNNSKDSLITIDGVPQNYNYNTYLCGLEWSKCQYPDADGDDEGDPELVKEFSEKIVKMKPYFDKWKREAKKFSPYFELELVIDEPDENYYFCDFSVFLNCKWRDKYDILKPGLPEFKK